MNLTLTYSKPIKLGKCVQCDSDITPADGEYITFQLGPKIKLTFHQECFENLIKAQIKFYQVFMQEKQTHNYERKH